MNKILVIEDQSDFRRMITRSLTLEGYEVLGASNGIEGIKKFKDAKPDLVLTDVKMPKKNGVELLREIKNSESNVDVVILTGHSNETTAIDCLRLGAFDYLLKPLEDIDVLLLSIRRAIQKRKFETYLKQRSQSLKTLNKKLTKEIDKTRQSEKDLRLKLELLNDWLWEMDIDGVYTYSNPTVVGILGYTREEIVGKSVFDLVPQEEVSRYKSILKKSAKFKKPFQKISIVLLHKDGDLVPVESSGIPFFADSGEMMGFRGIDRVISEGKRLNSEIEKPDLEYLTSELKKLNKFIPICASCKKIRDESGNWNQIEHYIEKHSEVKFTHSICLKCADELYGESKWYKNRTRKQ